MIKYHAIAICDACGIESPLQRKEDLPVLPTEEPLQPPRGWRWIATHGRQKILVCGAHRVEERQVRIDGYEASEWGS